MRDMLTLCFSLPQMTGFVIWGGGRRDIGNQLPPCSRPIGLSVLRFKFNATLLKPNGGPEAIFRAMRKVLKVFPLTSVGTIFM
jgi:hypothetical protein